MERDPIENEGRYSEASRRVSRAVLTDIRFWLAVLLVFVLLALIR